ncbi:putative glycosyltransferase AGO61, partial [Stegodyphus mimosarum]
MSIINKFIEHFLLPFCLIIICVIFYSGEYLKSTSNECPSYPKYENLNDAGDISTIYSSVFCRGSNHTDRLCHFRNLCYEPKSETFLVFHQSNSVISGVPHDRFDPALADFSSVADHNTQYFNYVDLPASAAQNFNISYIKGHSLMFRRFNPENLMHVFHDDLLPAFLTLKELCQIGVGMSCKDVFLTFADGRSSGPYADLYNKFLNDAPLYLKSLSSENLHCIQNVYIGLNKLTTWYHYGFKEPQGPLKKPFTGIYSVILEFRNYFIEQFNLNPKDKKPLAMLLTRKHNRRILNENEVMKTLQMYSDLETCIMNLENHSVLEVIKIVLQSKIIVGMHGSLLVVSLFLEPNSVIIELFPFGVNPDLSTPYKTLANIPGLKLIYLSWE